MTSPAWRPRWRGRPASSPEVEHAVAKELAFDGGAGVLADDGAQRAVEIASLRAEGGVAEALCQGSGVGDVGKEDGSHAGGGKATDRWADLEEMLNQTRGFGILVWGNWTRPQSHQLRVGNVR